MDPIVTPAKQDKALYVAVIGAVVGVLVPWANQKLHLDLDPTVVTAQVAGVAASAAAFIVAHKWKTAKLMAAQIAAGGIPGTTTSAAPK